MFFSIQILLLLSLSLNPSMASPSQPLSLSLSLDSSLKPFLSGRHCHLPSISFPKQPLSLSLLHCSPTPQIQTETQTQEPSQNQAQTFLCPQSLANLQTLSAFSQTHTFPHGILKIRPMRDTELDAVSDLLSESFIETLFFPPNYAKLLAFLVKNYLMERRVLVPHTTVLVGLYFEGRQVAEELELEQEQGAQMAGTAEISFDELGANAASPTPVPPRDHPYICNMTVRNSLRRYVSLPFNSL